MKDIMLDNLNKADERSGKLEDLEDRADQLLVKVTCCWLARWPQLPHVSPGEATLVCEPGLGGAAEEGRRRTSTLLVSDGGIFREAFPPGRPGWLSGHHQAGRASRSRDSPADPLPLPCVSNSISCC